MSTNVCTISGNAGADARSLTTNNGTVIAEFSLASTRYKLSSSGEKTSTTSWIPVKGFGRVAERIGSQVLKGVRVIVTGSLVEESWIDKQSGQKRSRLVLMADSFELIGGTKAADKGQASTGDVPTMTAQAVAVGQDYSDNIPF